MNPTGSTLELNDVLSQLSKKENAEALLLLVDNLPGISRAVTIMEELTVFANSAYQDKQSLEELFNTAEVRMETLGINKQALNSIIGFVQLTPQLVPLLKNMMLGLEFMKEIIKDDESVQFIMNELKPFAGKLMDLGTLLARTNKRYENDPSIPSVSIFKIVSLLKDENVRKGYKYLQAFLSVLSEKQSLGK